ncbi:MAG: hypothetical protein ACRCV3_03750 [Desulfovibrionaceae bacterium]
MYCINKEHKSTKQHKERSENNDFVLIESDEHRRLLALYHAIYSEREDPNTENKKNTIRAFAACNLFYLG